MSSAPRKASRSTAASPASRGSTAHRSRSTRQPTRPLRRQFELFQRFWILGLDIYAYATFTTPDLDAARPALVDFVDRLQRIHPLLPLRTVPLEVTMFTPVQSRMNGDCEAAMANQYAVASYWEEELARRFAPTERAKNICDLAMK